jgi:hypothetical protein
VVLRRRRYRAIESRNPKPGGEIELDPVIVPLLEDSDYVRRRSKASGKAHRPRGLERESQAKHPIETCYRLEGRLDERQRLSAANLVSGRLNI